MGKLAMPDAILKGTGALGPGERARIRRHPGAGGDLLRRAGLADDLVAAAAAHHERFDGAGYPAGLAGSAIPAIARVVAVADAIDAIVSRRSYKEARPAEAARSALVAERGRQFDPAVVDYALARWAELAALLARDRAPGP
jgi:putative two-component system response regulator